MFTGNSQVKTWSNWFVLPHMIQYPDSSNYQLPELYERLRFLLLPTHSNPRWLKMAAEGLLQHINFSKWSNFVIWILTIFFPLHFSFTFRDLSNLELPSDKPKHNILKTIFRLSLIAEKIMRFLCSTRHSKQTS